MLNFYREALILSRKVLVFSRETFNLRIPLLHFMFEAKLSAIIVLPRFTLKPDYFLLAELVDGRGGILYVIIILCKHLDFLPCGGFKEGSPVVDLIAFIFLSGKIYTA